MIKGKNGLYRPGIAKLRHHRGRQTSGVKDPTRIYAAKMIMRRGILGGDQMVWTVRVHESTERGGERTLARRYELIPISMDPYSWGCESPAAQQTAAAILLDAVGKTKAIRWYKDFCREVLKPLRQDAGWLMAVEEVIGWVEKKESGQTRGSRRITRVVAGRGVCDV